MTIKCTATRNDNNSLHLLRIEVTEESLPIFEQLINRALNCWDSAPQEIKELGDMLTHGRVTQDHRVQPMFSKDLSRDYYTEAERKIIENYISQCGRQDWLQHVADGTVHKVLKGEA